MSTQITVLNHNRIQNIFNNINTLLNNTSIHNPSFNWLNYSNLITINQYKDKDNDVSHVLFLKDSKGRYKVKHIIIYPEDANKGTTSWLQTKIDTQSKAEIVLVHELLHTYLKHWNSTKVCKEFHPTAFDTPIRESFSNYVLSFFEHFQLQYIHAAVTNGLNDYFYTLPQEFLEYDNNTSAVHTRRTTNLLAAFKQGLGIEHIFNYFYTIYRPVWDALRDQDISKYTSMPGLGDVQIQSVDLELENAEDNSFGNIQSKTPNLDYNSMLANVRKASFKNITKVTNRITEYLHEQSSYGHSVWDWSINNKHLNYIDEKTFKPDMVLLIDVSGSTSDVLSIGNNEELTILKLSKLILDKVKNLVSKVVLFNHVIVYEGNVKNIPMEKFTSTGGTDFSLLKSYCNSKTVLITDAEGDYQTEFKKLAAIISFEHTPIWKGSNIFCIKSNTDFNF